MNIMGTSGSYQTAAASGSTASSSVSGGMSLSMGDFFKLLAAQMSNQSMMNPVDDTQFISQMAQFSSLQQLSDMAKAFTSTMAVSFVGKNVKVTTTGDDGRATEIEGEVEKVLFNNGTPLVSVNGTLYDMANITQVLKGE